MARGLDSFWFDQYQESNQRVLAACRAVGMAGSLLDPDERWDDTDRLVRLRDVVDDLRAALGLPDAPALHTHTTSTTTTTSTDSTDGSTL
ncbi:hypothetical protein Kisp01_14750 [Kineosporia sp. NBRC 101677]|uniref:hypothetical protein n=1 Tax=Kineosporia sp. NBRC 101677 TaxID=3032197 RepID=UPI0024A38DB1|nr:hypothetical protein [Kineosporia sp. NBRC 101677]GLY14460.1 hypothetical protein Kisp01_14750 [Kineosporia sp. NBRC 101677]